MIFNPAVAGGGVDNSYGDIWSYVKDNGTFVNSPDMIFEQTVPLGFNTYVVYLLLCTEQTASPESSSLFVVNAKSLENCYLGGKFKMSGSSSYQDISVSVDGGTGYISIAEAYGSAYINGLMLSLESGEKNISGLYYLVIPVS